MSYSLVDLNLQQFPDAYLAGTWRVESRALHSAPQTAPLAQATHLHLHEEGLRLDTLGTPLSGDWCVTRDPLLSRPYLEFSVGGETVRALITRLRRSTDGLYQALVLYFQSGLELVLTQP
ncbi:hypothetical protein [Hymenobacter rigui]|uniref:Lipocalin-like domain-containing protein n=1 Tax=Hymenobacter rigui TaxID=334424 RepID=A0A3R9MJT2_9BACT|nr:hypothetical protein [Hymenobacter rigui]RSK47549.1 hypothetical protein EI291_14935 [Hymenobacter rigui]